MSAPRLTAATEVTSSGNEVTTAVRNAPTTASVRSVCSVMSYRQEGEADPQPAQAPLFGGASLQLWPPEEDHGRQARPSQEDHYGRMRE